MVQDNTIVVQDKYILRLVIQYTIQNTILVQDKDLFRLGKWCHVIYTKLTPPKSTSSRIRRLYSLFCRIVSTLFIQKLANCRINTSHGDPFLLLSAFIVFAVSFPLYLFELCVKFRGFVISSQSKFGFSSRTLGIHTVTV